MTNIVTERLTITENTQQNCMILLITCTRCIIMAVVGNFNLIIDAANKSNTHTHINRHNMAMLRRVVDDLELRDIHLHEQ
jgi:hypothetical protein